MDQPAAPLRTPLYEEHTSLGARIVPFAGFEMPIQYQGIIEEHLAVRHAAGLFDVSHMGEILVSGPHALAFIQRLVTNDAGKLYDGRVLYTVMCAEDGGIVDDLLVYRFSEEQYMLVVNAANIEKDWAWMQAQNIHGAELENASSETALIALQGPAAADILERLTDLPVRELAYYHALQPEPGTFLGCRRAVLSATGYTGEKGFEIYCEPERAAEVWRMVIEAGAPHGLVPVGLGARDTLRMEAGYCLYGNDITADTNPLEAGLGWVTKFDKGEFVGRTALEAVRAAGPARRLVAFVAKERGIPRHGYEIENEDGARIGEVTSGTQSPVLGVGIGMGYVPNKPEYTKPGSRVRIRVRNRSLAAEVAKPPLHSSNA